MLPICTSEEIKNIDSAAINQDLDLGFSYMEKAASGLFDLIENLASNSYINDVVVFPNITVLCGKGNNGGDGFLLAYNLAQKQYSAKVFSLAKHEDLDGEAKLAYEKLLAYQENQDQDLIITLESEEDFKILSDHLEDSFQNEKQHFLVDALLGAGAKGAPQGLYKKAVDLVNYYLKDNPKLKIIAVDSPTGLDNDSGSVHEPAISADYTVTMGFPKLGSFFYPARKNYNKTFIQTLDYPEEIIDKEYESNTYILQKEDYKKLLPKRNIIGSKYDHGVACLVAGSKDMPGAACLAGTGALRSGLGMLHIITRRLSAEVVSSKVTEAIVHSLVDDMELQIDICHNVFSKKVNVCCIGPGLTTQKQALVQYLVKNIEVPFILDADGLNSFAGQAELMKDRKSELLITPHAGEYDRLFPGDITEDMSPAQIIEKLRARAMEYKMTILYKGSPTIIAAPGGKVFLSSVGNSALATAGSGDVLSGFILGFAAQIFKSKIESEIQVSKLTQATLLAAYIHGKAGELASDQLTEYSVIASDLVDYIPPVIKSLL